MRPTELPDQVNRAVAAVGRNLDWEEWEKASLGGGYQPVFPSLPVGKSVIDSEVNLIATSSVKGRETEYRAPAWRVAEWAVKLQDPEECNDVAWELANAHQGEAALLAVQCALKSFPDNPEYRDTRGAALAAVGDTRGAIRDFEYLIHKRGFDPRSAADVAKRMEWIASLRKGDNPFH